MEFTNVSAFNNVTSSDPAMSTNVQQHQIIFVQAPTFKRSFERYPSKVSFYLSCIQIGTGIMSIILGIANPLTCGMYGMVGIGIWGGLLVSFSGFILLP